ncbi:hypothetical protein [Microcoleus sp. N9_A1]
MGERDRTLYQNIDGRSMYEGINIREATGLTTISTDALNCPIFDR